MYCICTTYDEVSFQLNQVNAGMLVRVLWVYKVSACAIASSSCAIMAASRLVCLYGPS